MRGALLIGAGALGSLVKLIKANSMPLRFMPVLALLVFLWSFNGIAIKVGVSKIAPLLMTTLRFIIVSLLIVPFTRLKREQFKQVLLISFTLARFISQCCSLDSSM